MGSRDFNLAAFENHPEDMERMMDVLTDSFSHVRELLRHTTGDQAAGYARRIEQANVEFTRLRASSMRASMEENLARVRTGRRHRRRNEDSYSSSESDGSDNDYDYNHQIERQKFYSMSKASTSSTNDQSTNTNISGLPPLERVQPSPEPMVTDPPPIEKRKASNEMEDAPPAKRTCATTTDDMDHSC